jgi:hypothetical protein
MLKGRFGQLRLAGGLFLCTVLDGKEQQIVLISGHFPLIRPLATFSLKGEGLCYAVSVLLLSP